MVRLTVKWAAKPWLPWLVWGVGSLFIAYQYSFQASTAIMVSQLIRAFSLSEEGLGFLSSTFFYTYLIMQIPVGMLLDRWGVRRILLLALVLFIVGLVVFAVSPNVWVAAAGRLIMGLATAPAVAAALCLAANWFSMSMFVLVAGLSEAIGMLGGLIGQGYMAQWVQQLGWRTSLWLWIAFGVLLLLASFLFVHDRPSIQVDEDPIGPPDELDVSAWARIKDVLSQSQVWWNGLYCGLTFAVNSAFAGLWGVPYLETVYGYSYIESAWLSSLIFVGVMIGSVLVPYLCDKLKSRRLVMTWASFLGAVAMSMLLLFTIKSIAWVVSILIIIGICSAVYIVPFANTRNLIARQSRGLAMAFINTCCIAIGAPVLQPFIGWVLHHDLHATQTGHFNPWLFKLAMWSVVGCFVLAFLIARIIEDVSEDVHTKTPTEMMMDDLDNASITVD